MKGAVHAASMGAEKLWLPSLVTHLRFAKAAQLVTFVTTDCDGRHLRTASGAANHQTSKGKLFENKMTHRPHILSQIITAVTGTAIFVLLAVSVTTITSFSPPAEASETTKASETIASPKTDRLAARPPNRECAQQAWPDFERSCLFKAEPGAPVQEARLIKMNR